MDKTKVWLCCPDGTQVHLNDIAEIAKWEPLTYQQKIQAETATAMIELAKRMAQNKTGGDDG